MKRVYGLMFSLVVMLCAVGCGSSSSSTPTPTPQTITLTGTLGTSSGNTLSKATTPAVGYMVVAVDNSTNETYHTTTDANGAFSISVPADTQFHLSLLNGGSYFGPTVFDGSGYSVNTMIQPTADLNLGPITVDTTSGYARADTAPSAVVAGVTAFATDGIPQGAGLDNDGKVVIVNGGNRSDMDMDKDGVPNLFDADEDNDGFRNGIIAVPTDTVAESAVVESVFMASNIWVPHGEVTAGMTHAEYAPYHIALRMLVTPKTGSESQISGVQCISVPSSIADIATVNTGSVGDAIDYPPEHSLWKDYSYNLYKMTTESANSWVINIGPNTVMNIGDTFTIRVTYTDGTYEDFFLTTSYVLTDWAWISTYNGGTLADSVGSRSTPATFDGDLTIVFNKPLDEDGLPLAGLRYSVTYSETTRDPSSGNWLVPAPGSNRKTIENAEITDNGDGTMTAALPKAGDSLVSGSTYYVVPIAESTDGQRNGEETWFTKN